MSKIPVRALYDSCRMMLEDKWGYIWGTAGRLWTAQLQANPPDDMAAKYGSRWIGHMVTDCSGVMVYIWKQHGLQIAHGSNSIARKYCGEMTTLPHPGYAAFKHRAQDTSKYPDGRGDFYHIGIVTEDGENVYESRGTREGFTTSPASKWAYFAPFEAVDYKATLPQSALRADSPLEEGAKGAEESEGSTVIYRAEVVTKKDPLNLRKGPGTDPTTGEKYEVIGKIPKGEIVDVMSESDGWAYVMDDGISGFASRAYLRAVAASPSADDDLSAHSPEAVKSDSKTILRHKESGITIGLLGDWEIIGETEGAD